jgi:RNA polymerase sigma factor (sigma-70 family)
MPRVVVSKVSNVWKRFPAALDAEAADSVLLRRFVDSRDELAFEALVRRHGSMVWGVCQRLLVHRQDVEDAFQTTFLVLARKAAVIGRGELLANWLYGVARRAALALRRSRGRRAVHEFAYGEVPDVPHLSQELWSELRPLLDEEIAQLPGKYRYPLLLCCLQGMTHAGAAETLGWPVGTVAGRLSRGRELLRTRLRRRGIVVSAVALTATLTESAFAAVPPGLVATSVVNGVVFAETGATAALSSTVALTAQTVLRQLAQTRAASIAWTVGALALALGGLGLSWVILATHDPVTELAAMPAANRLPDRPDMIVRRGGPRFISLPDDPQAVVLQLDFVDPQGKRPAVQVTVHRDGRVEGVTTTTVNGKPHSSTLEELLPDDDLQDLMQFVIHDQEIFDFDSTRVLQALQDEFVFDGWLKAPEDMTSVTIRIRTADQVHEVKWDQLSSSAVFFQEVRRIRQLHAVERRLQNLLCIMHAGGRAKIEDVTSRINQQWKQKTRPLTVDDLAFVNPAPNGKGTRYTYHQGFKYGGDHYQSVQFDLAPNGTIDIKQTIPNASNAAPKLQRRPWIEPRCFEDDLDG